MIELETPKKAGDCQNCRWNREKGLYLYLKNPDSICQHWSYSGGCETDTPDKWCPLRQYFALRFARNFLERYYTDQANSFQAQILDKALKAAGY